MKHPKRHKPVYKAKYKSDPNNFWGEEIATFDTLQISLQSKLEEFTTEKRNKMVLESIGPHFISLFDYVRLWVP